MGAGTRARRVVGEHASKRGRVEGGEEPLEVGVRRESPLHTCSSPRDVASSPRRGRRGTLGGGRAGRRGELRGAGRGGDDGAGGPVRARGGVRRAFGSTTRERRGCCCGSTSTTRARLRAPRLPSSGESSSREWTASRTSRGTPRGVRRGVVARRARPRGPLRWKEIRAELARSFCSLWTLGRRSRTGDVYQRFHALRSRYSNALSSRTPEVFKGWLGETRRLLRRAGRLTRRRAELAARRRIFRRGVRPSSARPRSQGPRRAVVDAESVVGTHPRARAFVFGSSLLRAPRCRPLSLPEQFPEAARNVGHTSSSSWARFVRRVYKARRKFTGGSPP